MDYEVIRIPGFGNPFVTIKIEDITEEVISLTNYLEGNKTESITGYVDNEAYPVKTESIPVKRTLTNTKISPIAFCYRGSI